jgi:serine/threonine protein kinase/ABC-type branched-subunit amino acid transport system substrate-binding protein
MTMRSAENVGLELAGGKYRVIAHIGGGGMADVYLAVTRGSLGDFQKLVVVKILRRSLAEDEEVVAMFIDEARLTARLNHPNVIQTYDVGEDAGRYYITMEYLEGESYEGIRRHVRSRNVFSLNMRLRMLSRALRGLHYAHELSDFDGEPLHVVHRDVTPSNVFVTYDGQVKLVDFGIAKARDSSVQTRVGVFKGKVGYMAPEQMFGGGSIDRQVDVYSAGVLMWEILAGVRLWKGVDQSEIFKRVINGRLPPPSAVAPSVDAELECICLRALAHRPEDRFPTAGAFEAELEAYLACHPPSVGEPELAGAVTDLFGESRASIRATIEAQLARSPGSNASLPNLSPSAYPARSSDSQPRGTQSVARGTRSSAMRSSFGDVESSKTPGGVSIPPPPALPQRPGRFRLVAGAAAAFGIALAAAVGVRVASCGADAQRAAAATVASASAAPGETGPKVRGVTDTEILVGMSSAFSGPARDYGLHMKLGVETAFAVENAKGGVQGRKLSLVALDDGYDAKRTPETMRQLLDDRGVFAIVGNAGTATAAVGAPYAVSKKTLFFGTFSGSNILRRDPPDRYVFNFRPSYEEEAGRIVRYLMDVKKISPDGIVLFAQKDAFGDAGFEGAVRALRRYGRSDSQLLRVGYERNSVDVDAAVNEIMRYNGEVWVGPNDATRAKHPVTAVIMMATHKPAARFVQKLTDRRIHPLLLATSASGGAALSDELRDVGALRAARGLVMTQVVPHYDSGGTGVIRYREALERFAPDAHPDSISLEGYIVGTLFAEAVRRSGRRLDTEGLVDTLETVHDLDLQVGSILSFGPSEHQASHKIWGTSLDEEGNFRPLELE